MSERSSEDAEGELRRRLELPYDPHKPLANLFAELSPESAERVAPAVVEAVRRGRMPFEGEDTHRLMSQIPERLWSNGYLCLRARIELSTRVLQVVLREIERRLADHPLENERKRLEKGLAQGRARALAQESPAVFEQRGHPIWRSAYAAVKQGRIRGTPHLGGPMVDLERPAYLDLARWAFDEASKSVVLDEPVKQVIDIIARRDLEALRALHTRRPEPVTYMFDLAERMAWLLLNPYGASLLSRARQIVRLAAFMMKQIDRGEAFVEALDREMMRLEAAGVLRRARKPVPDQFEVLARGVDERGKPSAWLLATKRSHIFVARVRKSWIYEKGAPEEVIASVPDRWFDLVANAIG